ncbi:hypothetical protein BD626DRAFT_449198 [Schizophyllum amplum]|uniref:Uncharacterized protein n=1 Tax=Schizophyllum amplum TaxID=97359 RepID=A0A550D0L9_9AGAR|nr:hypothetical protein BD626DRAFT_449198 [Auriculariopsis ampla]
MSLRTVSSTLRTITRRTTACLRQRPTLSAPALSQRPYARQYAYYAPRPPGIMPRLLYRNDGAPRSKKVGLVTALLALAGAGIVVMLMEGVYDLEVENSALLSLILLIRVDTYYSSIDFDDDNAILEHLHRILGALFEPESAPAIEAIIDALRNADPGLRRRALDIVRDSTHEIHQLLQRLDTDVEQDPAVDLILIAIDVQYAAHSVLQKIVDSEAMDVALRNIVETAVKHRPPPKEKEKAKDSEYELVA